MTEFEKLKKEGKVSRCGRWLEAPESNRIVYIFYKGEICFNEFGYDRTKDQMLNLGITFYSLAHAELARDTMEAEQICRRYEDVDLRIFMFPERKNEMMSEEEQFVFEKLLDHFGGKIFREIINQELSNGN